MAKDVLLGMTEYQLGTMHHVKSSRSSCDRRIFTSSNNVPDRQSAFVDKYSASGGDQAGRFEQEAVPFS